MSVNKTDDKSTLVSMEVVITNIKETRDELIDDLLTDAGLITFLVTHFETFVISPIKAEFLKRDLKELRATNLDLAHYAALIRHMKEHNQLLSDSTHPLFVEQCIRIFRKYGS